MLVIFGKLFIGIASLAATVLAVRSERLAALPFRSFTRLAWATSLCTRLAVFVSFYLVLGFTVPSDVPAAYYPEAKAALAGKLVYRDFFSTYGPLFPYLCAIPVKLWDSTKSIVLFAILIESLALPLWVKVFASKFSDRVVRIALICYALNPLLISTVAMAGQNHIWISPFLAAAVYLLQRRRDLWAGASLGLCLVATKFLALIFLPVLYLLSRRKTQFLGGFVTLAGAVCAAFWLKGADILLPLKFQRSAGQESSGNLPYILSLFGVPITSSLYVISALIILAGVCLVLWVYRGRLPDHMLISSVPVLIFVVVLLFSKKAFTTYWACGFFPLCVYWSHRFGAKLWPLVGFLAWGVTAMVEPTLYFRWVYGHDFVPAYKSAVFLACQAVLLGFSLVLLRYCLSDIRKAIVAGGPACEPALERVAT